MKRGGETAGNKEKAPAHRGKYMGNVKTGAGGFGCIERLSPGSA